MFGAAIDEADTIGGSDWRGFAAEQIANQAEVPKCSTGVVGVTHGLVQ